MNIKKLMLISVAAISAATAMAQTKITAPEKVVGVPGEKDSVEINFETTAPISAFDLKVELTYETVDGTEKVKRPYVTFDKTSIMMDENFTGVYNFNNSIVLFPAQVTTPMATIKSGKLCKVIFEAPEGMKKGTLTITGTCADSTGLNEENLSCTVTIKNAPVETQCILQEKESGLYVAFDPAFAEDWNKGALLLSETPYKFQATYDEAEGTCSFSGEMAGSTWTVAQSTAYDWNFTNTGETTWTIEEASEGYVYFQGPEGYWKKDGKTVGSYLFNDGSKSKACEFKIYDPTAISELKNNESEEAEEGYTLQGVRTKNAKGIVILNGKKVIR